MTASPRYLSVLFQSMPDAFAEEVDVSIGGLISGRGEADVKTASRCAYCEADLQGVELGGREVLSHALGGKVFNHWKDDEKF
ncbi:hypothetical protein M430DRAFT_22949 [Amorphotheca resinae ATCC 22711]|uniref:Uncharacterized protein n=1 Tax=Amorphotheca resinae ATCC 22711 TaxID=857342 RepID=A0A2T3AR33_AMORE|nr:hypothetical protein M430DRAFT_22949 [Amorphotheca resinae ATCC 22711]PSS08724.1 hypothetical protein M430DRAFT_22949 [Amorphotheca resinae ATCC 22711]